jgi:N-acetylglucosaminyldiphosphoundecaprenol N-acetyl-beta-D-mannosaminyltransferase
MGTLRTAEFLHIPFVAEEPKRVIGHIVEDAVSKKPSGLVVHLIPAHSVAESAKDAGFREVLNSGGIVVPDGRWLEILTKSNDVPLTQFRGTDLFLGVCEASVPHKLGHYFLGSSEELLTEVKARLSHQFDGIVIVGREEYPYGELSPSERKALAKRILDSGASFVWFGISTPRQNLEAQWLSEATGLTVLCVGAALEFVAGKKKMAPRWVQRAGLEWLHRFASEPRRLWRRYLLGSADFVRLYLASRRSN